MMRKPYTAPVLICEELHPETVLCGCDFTNPTSNEEMHCGFDPEGLGFTLFAQGWDNCQNTNGKFGNMQFCVQASEAMVFGS